MPKQQPPKPKAPLTPAQLHARLRGVGERAGWIVVGGSVSDRVEIAFAPAPPKEAQE